MHREPGKTRHTRKLLYEPGPEAMLRPWVSEFLQKGPRSKGQLGEEMVLWMAGKIFKAIDSYRREWVQGEGWRWIDPGATQRNGQGLSWPSPIAEWRAKANEEVENSRIRVAAIIARIKGERDADRRKGLEAELIFERADHDCRKADAEIRRRHANLIPGFESAREAADYNVKRLCDSLPRLRAAKESLQQLSQGVKAGKGNRVVDSYLKQCDRLISLQKNELKACREQEGRAEALGLDWNEVLCKTGLMEDFKDDLPFVTELAKDLIRRVQKVGEGERVARMKGKEIQKALDSGQEEMVAFAKAYDDYFGAPLVHQSDELKDLSVEGARRPAKASRPEDQQSAIRGDEPIKKRDYRDRRLDIERRADCVRKAIERLERITESRSKQS